MKMTPELYSSPTLHSTLDVPHKLDSNGSQTARKLGEVVQIGHSLPRGRPEKETLNIQHDHFSDHYLRFTIQLNKALLSLNSRRSFLSACIKAKRVMDRSLQQRK